MKSGKGKMGLGDEYQLLVLMALINLDYELGNGDLSLPELWDRVENSRFGYLSEENKQEFKDLTKGPDHLTDLTRRLFLKAVIRKDKQRQRDLRKPSTPENRG